MSDVVDLDFNLHEGRLVFDPSGGHIRRNWD